jgi:hypothetical protein
MCVAPLGRASGARGAAGRAALHVVEARRQRGASWRLHVHGRPPNAAAAAAAAAARSTHEGLAQHAASGEVARWPAAASGRR